MPLYESVAKVRAALLQDPHPEFVHIYPPYDRKQHLLREYPGQVCWCEPQQDHIDPRIVVHSPSH